MKKSKSGFTLIELIVVLAILAIIATLAIPAYSGLKDSSAKRIAEANVRTVLTAFKSLQAQGKLDGNFSSTSDGRTDDNADKVKKILGEDFPGIITVIVGPDSPFPLEEISWRGEVNGSVIYESTYKSDGTYVTKKDTGKPKK